MLGIDLVDAKRIAKLDKDGRLQNRILSEQESAELQLKSKAVVRGKLSEHTYSLAGRFAAKEATLKALGLGLGAIDVKAIEVLHKPSGQPYVKLPADVVKQYNLEQKDIQISISHDVNMAIAVVNIVPKA